MKKAKSNSFFFFFLLFCLLKNREFLCSRNNDIYGFEFNIQSFLYFFKLSSKRINIRCFKRMLRGRVDIRHNLRRQRQLNLSRCTYCLYFNDFQESVTPLAHSNGAGDSTGRYGVPQHLHTLSARLMWRRCPIK